MNVETPISMIIPARIFLWSLHQELHYGDTAMAFAALTGCMEVHRYGTYLGNTKALTKARNSSLRSSHGPILLVKGGLVRYDQIACFWCGMCYFFLKSFLYLLVGFRPHFWFRCQASSGTPVKWQVTSRQGLTVRVKSDLTSTKLGLLARHAVFEELDREGYRSWDG